MLNYKLSASLLGASLLVSTAFASTQGNGLEELTESEIEIVVDVAQAVPYRFATLETEDVKRIWNKLKQTTQKDYQGVREKFAYEVYFRLLNEDKKNILHLKKVNIAGIYQHINSYYNVLDVDERNQYGHQTFYEGTKLAHKVNNQLNDLKNFLAVGENLTTDNFRRAMIKYKQKKLSYTRQSKVIEDAFFITYINLRLEKFTDYLKTLEDLYEEHEQKKKQGPEQKQEKKQKKKQKKKSSSNKTHRTDNTSSNSRRGSQGDYQDYYYQNNQGGYGYNSQGYGQHYQGNYGYNDRGYHQNNQGNYGYNDRGYHQNNQGNYGYNDRGYHQNNQGNYGYDSQGYGQHYQGGYNDRGYHQNNQGGSSYGSQWHDNQGGQGSRYSNQFDEDTTYGDQFQKPGNTAPIDEFKQFTDRAKSQIKGLYLMKTEVDNILSTMENGNKSYLTDLLVRYKNIVHDFKYYKGQFLETIEGGKKILSSQEKELETINQSSELLDTIRDRNEMIVNFEEEAEESLRSIQEQQDRIEVIMENNEKNNEAFSQRGALENARKTYAADCEILGVEQTDTFNAKQKAYRKKSVKLHPDKGGDEEQFKRLNAAWARIKLLDENKN